jgi:hypothetical protein
MIYVTGDLHGVNEIWKLKPNAFPAGQALTKDDFVVILGDFGLVWSPEQKPRVQNQESRQYTLAEQEEYWLNWFSDQPWTTLIIDGNHENHERLQAYPIQNFHGGKASQIHNTIWYLRRGEVFELCGKTCFVMGGAMSIDRKWRVKGDGWWPQEVPSQEDRQNAQENLALHNDRVDLVFTHTCPLSVKAKLPLHGHLGNVADKLDFADPTETMLEALMGRMKFGRWYFAHFHLDAQIRDDTRFTCVFDKVLKVAG